MEGEHFRVDGVLEGDFVIMTCTTCGPLGLSTPETVKDDALAHLREHGCNLINGTNPDQENQ